MNHPDAETRISCSSCGDPICTRCMRTAAVGQKCPSCARSPRSARALGKPQHYVRAVGGGLVAAVIGGVVYAQVLTAVRFGSLILAALLGFAIGRVVRWGSRGQSQQPFLVIAATLGVLGVLVAFMLVFRTPLAFNGLLFLAYPVAGFTAARGLQS